MSRALVAIHLPERTASAGPPSEVAWIALSQLVVDEAYQRQIETRGLRTIERIGAEFSWSKFSPAIVAALPKNRFAIIDGQHRCTAALSLGYEKVPCMVVKATPSEAAAIFSAINGNVTYLSPLAVFRAARAAGSDYAKEIDRISESAGVKVLVHQVPASRMKPLECIAVGALREILQRHGPEILSLTLKGLAKGINSQLPGLLNSKRLRSLSFLLSLHRGWLEQEQSFLNFCATLNFWHSDWERLEPQFVKKLGDGRSAGAGWDTIKIRVAELAARKFKPQMIAGITRLPHAEVQRALTELAEAKR